MFSLRTKFFVAILVVNTALAVGLYLFLRFSFEASFTQYVSQRERSMSETFATELEKFYRQAGSWDQFRESGDFWSSFSREYGRPQRPDMPDGFGGPPPFKSSQDNRGPGPRSGPSSSRFLLDHDRRLVAGKQWPSDKSYFRPLDVDDKTIGYLGVPVRGEMRDYLDQQFAKGQSKNLVIIILLSFFVALLIAVPLSHLLANKISRLVEYVELLSRRQYHKRLPFEGKDELSVLAVHLNDLGATLEKAEQQRKHWVADISHELRTPVSILQADLESMEDGIRNLDNLAVQRLQKHLLRLKNLIDDLHNLSLSDAGSLTYKKEALDLKALVSLEVAALSPQFEAQGLRLLFESAATGNYIVLGDGQRLSQLLLNLLQNSLSYTNAPGETRVSLHHDQNNIVIEIFDSAPGVESQLQSKLTERLFRVDTSRARNSGGAGLGLSLCENIVGAHSGLMTFSDSLLGGLCVSIKIPVHHGSIPESQSS